MLGAGCWALDGAVERWKGGGGGSDRKLDADRLDASRDMCHTNIVRPSPGDYAPIAQMKRIRERETQRDRELRSYYRSKISLRRPSAGRHGHRKAWSSDARKLSISAE